MKVVTDIYYSTYRNEI